MKLTFLFDHMFLRDPQGRIYTRQMFDKSFWRYYREVFERMIIVSRVRDVAELPEGVSPADADGVDFHAVPPYVGPWDYLRNRKRVLRRVREAVEDAEAIILRVPSTIGTAAWRMIRRSGRPYAVEVCGDPWDSLSPGTVSGLARPVSRRIFARVLRAQCREADAAAYVSREGLQRRYPPGQPERATHYNNVALEPAQLREAPREDFQNAHRIVHVGTLEVFYKAPETLAEAVARCRRSDIQLTYVGDGRRRGDLERIVRELGIEKQVRLLGRLPGGEAVRRALDESDLFVLASRQEGLPRAMVEAMARALPCIGSPVGGIPELLDRSELVPPGDAKALAAKITELLDDPERLRRLSARNLELAREACGSDRFERRRHFYEVMRDLTQQWLDGHR